MFTIASHRRTLTTALGEAWSTMPLAQSIVHQIFVKAATPSTVFRVVLETSDGDYVYDSSDVTGLLNDEILLPFAQDATLYILDATSDEAFTCVLTVRES